MTRAKGIPTAGRAGTGTHGGTRSATAATVLRCLALSTTWGSSFAFLKVALDGMTPGQIVLARLTGGALCLIAVAAVQRLLPRIRVQFWWHIATCSVLGNVIPLLLLSYGKGQRAQPMQASSSEAPRCSPSPWHPRHCPANGPPSARPSDWPTAQSCTRTQ